MKTTRSSIRHALVAPKSFVVRANRTYFMGASSSPEQVYVLSVDGDVVTHVRCGALKFDREKALIVRTPSWIAEDLMARGTATRIAVLRGAVAHLPAEWYGAELARLEAQLAGKETAEEPIDAFKGVTMYLVATSPIDRTKGRAGDPWYAAEEYGNVGAREREDGTYVYRVETTIADERAARQDPRFVVVDAE